MTAAAPSGAPASPTLAGKAVRASAWVLGGYLASHVVRLAGNLVLTRLLFPEVFGLASLIQVFLQGLQMFSDVGTAPAIVQSARGDDPRFVNTAWTIACVRGFALWGAAALLAAPFAAFYGEPLLAQVLPVAGATAALGGLESTSIRLAHRHLRAERLVAVELAAQIVNIVAIVVLALAVRSARGSVDLGVIWVVVAGGIASGLTRVAVTHALKAPFRNRLCLDRDALRDLLGFGRWVFLSTILTFVAGQSDRLLFGKLVSLEVLGIYGVALNLSQIAVQLVQKLGSMVMFPTYSRLASQGTLEPAYRRARLPLLLAGGAIAAGFVACGPSLVRILYDRRYADAGWMLQILAAGAWARVLEATNGAALLGQGRVRWMAAGSGAKLAGLVTLVPLGMHLRGFPGALVGLALSDVLQYAASAVGVAAGGLRGFRQDLRATVAVAAVSGAALAAAHAAGVGGTGLAELLVTGAVVGAAAGAAGAWYLRRHRAERAARVALEPGGTT